MPNITANENRDKKIVKDHRKDPNYSSWHDAYKQYQTLTLYE